MELTEKQITFIRQEVLKNGITMGELADSLIDHICCTIENDPGGDFQEAYARAIASFGDAGLIKIQRDTILLINLKKELYMKKTMFLLGYIAAFLLTTGLLFKLQQWPGAAIILTLGIALLNFGFLPMFFYYRYKKAVN